MASTIGELVGISFDKGDGLTDLDGELALPIETLVELGGEV